MELFTAENKTEEQRAAENELALSVSVSEAVSDTAGGELMRETIAAGTVFGAMAAGPASIDRSEVLHSKERYWIGRRVQDIFFSLLALIVLSPLFLIIALVIYIDDPKGGPIFSQDRCGRDGRTFRMYKFRTMCVNAEEKLRELLAANEMDGPAFKMKNDPRVTRIGRVLRKTSLDELPQLWNVLKGDMSIVGPRPTLPREVEQYNDYQRQRMYVTPGLTCYWQIQPNRNSLTFDEWMDLDIKYIRERSFLVDWKIIFMTVKVVLFGYGE